MTAVAVPAPAAGRADNQSTRAELRAGALAMLPLVAGYAPFALLVGTSVANSSVTAAGWAATVLVYGGSAQLALIDLLDDGVSAGIAVATVLVVQTRLLVYSASLAPRWRSHSLRWRAAAAATIIDPTLAIAQARHARPGTDAAMRAHWVGAAAVLTVGWSLFVSVGVVAGSRLPEAAAWKLVAPLALVALVVPQLGSRGARRAAAVAVAIGAAGSLFPPGIAVLVAMAAGMAVGGSR